MMTDQQRTFLAEANVAILSTVDGKGRPHAAPVWYLYDDDEIIVSTGRSSQKHRNVERNPEISLTVDRRTLPYFAVTVYGRAHRTALIRRGQAATGALPSVTTARRYIDMTRDED
jgi:PPOX class probable F420-dependent enzyme